jgi:hypothetical protein
MTSEYRILVVNTQGGGSVGDLSRRTEDDTKVDSVEVRCEDVDSETASR